MFLGKKQRGKKQNQDSNRDSHIPHIAAGMFAFVIGALLLAAFVDFSPEQTQFVSTATLDADSRQNILGSFGANAVFFSFRYFGMAGWLIPVALLYSGAVLMRSRRRFFDIYRALSFLLVWSSMAAILDYVQWKFMTYESFLQFSNNQLSAGLGGIVGYVIFRHVAEKIFSVTGGIALLTLVCFLSATYAFSPESSIDSALRVRIKQYGYFHAVIKEKFKRFFVVLFRVITFIVKLFWNIICWLFPKIFALKKRPSAVHESKPNKVNSTTKLEPIKEIKKVAIPDGYVLPTTDLLQRSKKIQSEDDHISVMKQLVSTLAQFGITVNPGEVHSGPVITRYEISPAPGVRVEKIVNLDKNIALNLRAQSVRILAPVPGRGCVGVELPNKNPQMVCLREILESQDWQSTRSDIPIVLGRGTTGEPMINDLAKMPHLLIAGSTGSGKTVCINSIIASLVFHSTPNDLRFIMVDPKIVEMQVFNKLPHMLIPVVTDPKKVPNALKWLISEMELRYKIFAKAGVRNIAGFNGKILKDAQEAAKAEELEKSLSPEERTAVASAMPDSHDKIDMPKTKMPYIVCIIDELADLMMVAPADIETSVARLAQLARAAGIHLILATQRPSVNVITGIIKANLPSRIAFKVASKVDSRTILDTGGAEALLGRGDMLFQPPGASGLLRAQGALVSDEEINSIVNFLHDKNGEPEYAMDVHAMIESGENEDDDSFNSDEWEDEMMPRALEIIKNSDRASTSLLQRRLKIGYNRAARIMEALEAKGLISNRDQQSRPEL